MRVGATRFPEDRLHHVVEIMICVGIVIAFRESIDEDSRIGSVNLNHGIRSITMVYRQEDVARRLVWVAAIETMRSTSGALFAILTIQDMIANDGMNFNFPEEAASSLGDAIQKECDRSDDSSVYAVFNTGENGDKDACKEDEKL